MVGPSRRRFIKEMLAGAATIAIAGTKSSGTVLGANDSVRLAVAGVNRRGNALAREFAKKAGVQIVCLIDPDQRVLNARARDVVNRGGRKPQMLQDVRKALEDKNIDALAIATPNHWHALMTIWACQAGKDVYVEKPCSHNVHEGRIAVEIARKYQRIVQHGTAQRSDPGWYKVLGLIKAGKLGKLLVSRGLCYKARLTIGTKPVSSPPRELDFNLWLGPAAVRPFHANLVHYNWHWFWDFGNGDIGNQGIHHMDVARWMIPGATFPKSVVSLGGRFGYSDQGETPNTQIAVFDYGETQLIFEVRGLLTRDYRGERMGNVLHFEEGTITGGGKTGIKFYPKGKDKPAPLPTGGEQIKHGPGSDHFDNFLAAVRSRKQSDLNADILEGHYSSALCHLANISYRLGKQAPFHPTTKAFGDNKAVYETLERMEEHLSQGNGLKLDGQTYRLGRKLIIDVQNEQIVNDPAACKLLTRNYRKPFVVPEKV